MRRYTVIIEDEARADIQKSYDWGCRAWGVKQAQKWVRDLRAHTRSTLTVTPEGFPLAPENEESSEEIRQMIIGRYRVLFVVKGKKVHVLHVRGAYVGSGEPEEGEE